MKVLVALLSVGFAGTERHAIELANALAERCEVALLLRARPSEPHRQAGYLAQRRLVAPNIKVYEASRAMPVLGLWYALLRFRPDLIHAHLERSARIASRWSCGVPVLATIHMHFRARDFMRCAGLICLTDSEAARVPAAYRGIREVVPNWVLPHPRPSDARLASLRAELGLTTSDFVIGTVARLEPVKEVDGLIRAFARTKIPNARLVIVGDGSQRLALEQVAARVGVSGTVVFTGFRQDARDLYALFDLFVLNSNDEPYALAILEAVEAGIPVIATATEGAIAMARHLSIHLVPIGSGETLEAALRLGATGGIPAPPITGFGIDERLSSLQTVYDRIVTRKRSGVVQSHSRSAGADHDLTSRP